MFDKQFIGLDIIRACYSFICCAFSGLNFLEET